MNYDVICASGNHRPALLGPQWLSGSLARIPVPSLSLSLSLPNPSHSRLPKELSLDLHRLPSKQLLLYSPPHNLLGSSALEQRPFCLSPKGKYWAKFSALLTVLYSNPTCNFLPETEPWAVFIRHLLCPPGTSGPGHGAHIFQGSQCSKCVKSKLAGSPAPPLI